jgi:hypothetical protein
LKSGRKGGGATIDVPDVSKPPKEPLNRIGSVTMMKLKDKHLITLTAYTKTHILVHPFPSK